MSPKKYDKSTSSDSPPSTAYHSFANSQIASPAIEDVYPTWSIHNEAFSGFEIKLTNSNAKSTCAPFGIHHPSNQILEPSFGRAYDKYLAGLPSSALSIE